MSEASQPAMACFSALPGPLIPGRAWPPHSPGSPLRVCSTQRVEYFKGSKLVDTLLGPKYKGKLAKDTPIKSRAEAAKLGQELLRLGFFHRSQRVTHAHTRRWELELLNGPFEETGLYTWVYEGERRCARMLAPWGRRDSYAQLSPSGRGTGCANFTRSRSQPPFHPTRRRLQNEALPHVRGHAARGARLVHDPNLAAVAQGADWPSPARCCTPRTRPFLA